MVVKRHIPREIRIEGALIKRVADLGGLCVKVTTIGSRGFFDRLVILPGGKVVFCEVKRPKRGIVSEHQRQRHATYKNLGAEVAIILSQADIDRVFASPAGTAKTKGGTKVELVPP